MISQDQLFNEYYFDLLKKLKSCAREIKQESHDARVVLRAIKKHYSSYDKLSPEFRGYLNENTALDSYAELENTVTALDDWVAQNNDMQLYKDVQLSSIAALLSNTFILHHYITLINLLRKPLTEDELKQIVELLKDVVKDIPEGVSFKHELERIKYLQNKRTEDAVKSHINSIPNIEDTSLGKLAKEIMQEMNVDELQTSLGNGDIMSALANPDGGLIKLLGTVSQKMISKMSTGELKQENLLQDAMKLATQIGGKDMGALGNMASMFGDMGDLSSMMRGMMGGQSSGSTKVRPNTANIKKMSKKQDLRLKLEKKKQSKENMSGQVVDGNE